MEELEKSLKTQKAAYEQKLASLSEKEKEIQQQKDVFEVLKIQIQEMQSKLDLKVIEVEQAEQTNLKRLATLYTKMDPENAVSLLMDMDKERAAKVLTMISERQAGAILNAAVTTKGDNGTKTAVEWSDIIRRMKGKAK